MAPIIKSDSGSVDSSSIISALGFTPFNETGDTLTGTGGAGFYGAIPQSSAPSTPGSGFRLYANASGLFEWKGTNGFTRTFDGATNTANRTYTLPDASGTIALTSDLSSYFPVAGGSLTGTGGAGFYGAIPQSSAPSTPASGFRLYANASGLLEWKGTNGFTRTFDGSANTADRAYTLPNSSGTIALEGTLTSLANPTIQNGVYQFVQTTAPTQRAVGVPLVAGDRWFKPTDNGSPLTAGMWVWKSPYWLSSSLQVKELLPLGGQWFFNSTTTAIKDVLIPHLSWIEGLSFYFFPVINDESNYFVVHFTLAGNGGSPTYAQGTVFDTRNPGTPIGNVGQTIYHVYTPPDVNVISNSNVIATRLTQNMTMTGTAAIYASTCVYFRKIHP